uniref:hypothetical protein n=1 Tax=Klebsiella aerogenes TaxID=548 RepID=UPI001BCE597B
MTKDYRPLEDDGRPSQLRTHIPRHNINTFLVVDLRVEKRYLPRPMKSAVIHHFQIKHVAGEPPSVLLT